jgi:hypothetical protein
LKEEAMEYPRHEQGGGGQNQQNSAPPVELHSGITREDEQFRGDPGPKSRCVA